MGDAADAKEMRKTFIVPAIKPFDHYDFSRAKIACNLAWLVAKAFGTGRWRLLPFLWCWFLLGCFATEDVRAIPWGTEKRGEMCGKCFWSVPLFLRSLIPCEDFCFSLITLSLFGVVLLFPSASRFCVLAFCMSESISVNAILFITLVTLVQCEKTPAIHVCLSSWDFSWYCLGAELGVSNGNGSVLLVLTCVTVACSHLSG